MKGGGICWVVAGAALPDERLGTTVRAMLSFLGPIPAQLFVSFVVVATVLNVMLITTAYLIYLERKISAYIQDRIGPNRVGFDFGLPMLSFLKGKLGLGQPLADGLKFLLKEDYRPPAADRWLFTLAPIVSIVPAMIGAAIIPWAGQYNLPDLTIPILGLEIVGGPVQVMGAHVGVGIVYLLAVASLGVYGVTLGGWASNNKYSMLGGLRASAQMISYEIPLGLSLIAALLLMGTLMPDEIVRYQLEHGWMIFAQPIAAVLFFIAILAEANRAPFDNAEAEQELVGGYHTEYSAMRFALFFLAEYNHMITSCAFFTLMFLGGWDPVPFLHLLGDGGIETGLVLVLIKFGVYFGKVVTLVCFMMVIRWTLPRLRYDQVMTMGWQAMIPLSLIVVVMTATMVYFDLRSLVPMLIANVALGGVVLMVQPMLPKPYTNRRVPMYGSRFCPMPGETVSHAPSHPMALQDDPLETAEPVSAS